MDWHNEATDKFCEALLTLKTKEECYQFLDDVCTIREVLDMSQRLSVAELLAKSTSYSVIQQQTGASTATISRVSKCYEYGSGGYKMTIRRMKGEDDG